MLKNRAITGRESQVGAVVGQEKRSGQVYLQVGNLEDTVSTIANMVRRLEGRIESVLLPKPPDGDSGAEGKAVPMAPLAEHLLQLNARATAVQENLQNILQRLEL